MKKLFSILVLEMTLFLIPVNLQASEEGRTAGEPAVMTPSDLIYEYRQSLPVWSRPEYGMQPAKPVGNCNLPDPGNVNIYESYTDSVSSFSLISSSPSGDISVRPFASKEDAITALQSYRAEYRKAYQWKYNQIKQEIMQNKQEVGNNTEQFFKTKTPGEASGIGGGGDFFFIQSAKKKRGREVVGHEKKVVTCHGSFDPD